MKSYAPALAAAVIAVTAISGLIRINVDHHMNLPPELNFGVVTSISEFNPQIRFGAIPRVYTTHTDINMRNEIKDSATIIHILQALQQAKPGDTITFHLEGYGGAVDTVLLLISNIKLTKAFVTMSVEAPVYSGHAYLALFGDALVMSPYSFLMLHESSVIDIDCASQSGTDRGVSNVEHCQAFKLNNFLLGAQLVMDLPYVTPAEKQLIMNGHDVYLGPEDIQNRIDASTLTVTN